MFSRFFGKKSTDTHAVPNDFPKALPQVPPMTYAEWRVCLQILQDGQFDDDILWLMSKGELSFTPHVAERFAEQMALVFNNRLTMCSDRLNRSTSYDEQSFLKGVFATRRTLTFLYCVASLPCFHGVLQKHLKQEIERYASQSQSSLETSAKNDRTGQMLSMVRHNSLINYEKTGIWTPSHNSSANPSVNAQTTETAMPAPSQHVRMRKFL
ncbi:MAG: hypothetical protein Q4G13_07840 [Moraxella sp.]|nr:hypothetical protein [Moraxella sp.]